MTKVYLSVRAQCSQYSRPATRNPVWSNPTTSASVSRARTSVRNPAQSVGGRAGHRSDRARRHRRAEQVRQRLRGALLGQELPHIEVDHDCGDPRSVLDSSVNPSRGLRGVRTPAAASRSTN